MNALLKDVFTEEAEAAGDPNIDLTAVMRTGTRRNRRRRIATTITAVAAAAAVIVGGTTAVRHVSAGEPQAPAANLPAVAASPFAERRATWAMGDTVHFGSDVLRAGSTIASFVQTDAGFVVAGKTGAVSFLTDRGSWPIGTGNTSHLLAADATGTVVGWVDAGPKVPQFVLYDVAAGREVARTATGNRSGAAAGDKPVRVVAIDDGAAYLAASDGLHRWTIAGGKDELLKPGVATSLVQGVANGQLVWERPATGGSTDLAVGPDLNAAYPKHYVGWHSNISPSARYLLTDQADEVRLFDLKTGNDLPLKFTGYNLIVPTQWKNDTQFYAVAFRSQEAAPLDLLICSTTALTCTATTPHFTSSQNTIQLPLGTPM